MNASNIEDPEPLERGELLIASEENAVYTVLDYDERGYRELYEGVAKERVFFSDAAIAEKIRTEEWRLAGDDDK